MSNPHRCYLCGSKTKLKELIPFTYLYAPGALREEEVKVEFDLCAECTDWARAVPDALNAIIEGREKKKHEND